MLQLLRRSMSMLTLLVAAGVLAGCASAPPARGPAGTAPVVGAAQMIRVGDRLREAGDDATAATIYRAAHQQDPRDPTALWRLGESLRASGEYREAVGAYEALLKLDPRHADGMRGMASALIVLNEAPRARDLLLAAVALKDSEPRIYSALGVAYDRLGEHHHAQAYYRVGLRLRPDDLALRNNLALSLILDGRSDEGLGMMRQIAAEPTATEINRRSLALAEVLVADQGAMRAAKAAPAAPAPVTPVQVAIITAPTPAVAAPAVAAPAAAAPSVAPPPTPITSPLPPAPAATDPRPSVETAVVATPAETESPAPTGSPAPTEVPPALPAVATVPARDETAKLAAIAPAAGPATDGDGFQVQFAALDSEAGAMQHWRRLTGKAPDVLSEIAPRIHRVEAKVGAVPFFRLRTAPLPTRADAERLCATLKERSVTCFVVRMDPPAKAAAAKQPVADTSNG